MTNPIETYLHAVEANLKARDATEHTHRPALKALIETFATTVTATNEPRQRTDCGAPDMIVRKRPGPVEIGWIETKDIGISLAQALKTDQLDRYRKALPNLILTDYLSFRWFVNGEPWGDAILASADSRGRITSDQKSKDATLKLFNDFLAQQPAAISKPKDLAQRMANLAHLIRDIVIHAFASTQASPLIGDLRQAMAAALIPDLEDPSKTAQFADLYAQTLTYGLFAARCNHSGKSGTFTRQGAAAEIPRTNPFLRRLFTTITGPDLDLEPYAGVVESLVGILSHSNIEEVLKDFGSKTARQDPVLHFYETFLATYDPKLREARGVYYTPEPVVQYIVRSVDHLLKTRFGIPEGLADTGRITYQHDTGKAKEKREAHRTLILDPATGTGTFLYAAVSLIRERFEDQKRAGMWSGYVRDHLLPRVFGFELLMAPYAVAHFKLGMQLA